MVGLECLFQDFILAETATKNSHSVIEVHGIALKAGFAISSGKGFMWQR
jgi:hypothetical protein